jgi:transmembrane sensor
MTDIVSRDSEAMAEAAAWIARLGGDEGAAADGLAFDAWLSAAPRNRAAYRQALVLMHDFAAHADGVTARLAELQTERAREAVAPARAFARRSSRRPWIAAAAGFALAAGLAVVVLPPIVAETGAITYATGKGQHQRVALADGSVIDLDAETRLSVTLKGSERRVALAEGQAIFDVVHDAKRPFLVQAADRTVRDVGTQFDVRKRADELTVTVARGQVEVSPDGSATAGRSVLLGPGQRLEVGRTGAQQLTAVDPQETFSWRAGRLVYRAQPLAEVVADLNRQFVEQTTISDPALGALPITGVIVLDNPRAVMARLSLMLPIRTVPSDKGLMLLRK